MIDARWHALADLLVTYSTSTKPGDRVLIDAVEAESTPLARAVHEAALRAGATSYVQFSRVDLDRALLTFGSEDQYATVPEVERYAMDWADVYVGLRGARNPSEFADIPAERLAVHRRVRGTLSALRNAGTRWVLVRVPTEPLAQQAETSLQAMQEMFFSSALIDWTAERRRLEPLQARLEAASDVRLVAPDTDLRFSTVGRRYVIGAGTNNVPDGELYTAPIEESVEGRVTFNLPAVYGGRRLDRVSLTFTNGEVVDATAETNEDLLRAVTTTDEGSRRLGEFGIGTNEGIDRYSYDILYDEKIAGTVHLALGRAYEECGGVNQSAIHWDLVLDLRPSGQLYLDGELAFKDGRWQDI